MRVAVVTDNDFEKVNGVTTTLRALLAHAPADVVPHVYTLGREAAEQGGYSALPARGVPIPFYTEMRMYWPDVAALRRRFIADGIGAIHLTTPGPAGLAARYLAASMQLPMVGSYHTELGEYTTRLSGSARLGAWMQDYMRWVYGSCRRILVPSVATLEALAAGGWDRSRLAVWSRGVDSTAFAPERRSPTLRARWGASDTRPAILYAGRLSAEKGLDILSRIRYLLDEYRVSYRLVLCGDGPMRRELETRLPDAVFTGCVPHEQMGQIMASADLLLFPSETDTLGNVVLEAQAAGLPVLVSDRGGPHQNMRDGRSGFVCRAGSESDFCWRLTQLIVDARARATMSAGARRYAESRAWGPSFAPLFDAYRSVTSTAVEEASGQAAARAAHA